MVKIVFISLQEDVYKRIQTKRYGKFTTCESSRQISISMMVGKYCVFKNAAYKLIATKPYTFDSGTVGLSAPFQFLQLLQWVLFFLKHDCSLLIGV